MRLERSAAVVREEPQKERADAFPVTAGKALSFKELFKKRFVRGELLSAFAVLLRKPGRAERTPV